MRASGQQPGTQRTRCAPDFGKEKGRAAKLERGSSSPRSRPGAAAASAAAAAVPPCTGPRKAPPAPASPGEQPERPAAPRVTAAARVSPGAAGRALRAAPHPRAAGAACWRRPRGWALRGRAVPRSAAWKAATELGLGGTSGACGTDARRTGRLHGGGCFVQNRARLRVMRRFACPPFRGRGAVGRGLRGSPCPTPLLKRGHLGPGAGPGGF